MASSSSQQRVSAALFLLSLLLTTTTHARPLPSAHHHHRHLAELVPDAPLTLTYHGGAVLTGPAPIPVYLLFYGAFTPLQRAILSDFIRSLDPVASAPPLNSAFPPSVPRSTSAPSLAAWWSLAAAYTDAAGASVAPGLTLVGVADIPAAATAPAPAPLLDADLPALVDRARAAGLLGAPATDPRALYVLLTAADVVVESFCRNSCGTHGITPAGALYAWVGDSATQCPGTCAWPFAPLPFGGPPTAPAVAPNGDVGADGMVIPLAAVLAGAATNPRGDAWFMGDAAAPAEVATSCPGQYGTGAFPGYPGALLFDEVAGGSFNVRGLRPFVVPAIVDKALGVCAWN